MKKKINLIKLYKNKKRKKFKREGSDLKLRIKKVWRKPKGIHSKLRKEKKNRGKKVKIGYKNNKLIRFLEKNGKKNFLINSEKDLKNLEESKRNFLISSKLGLRKRKKIILKLFEKKFKYFNLRKNEK